MNRQILLFIIILLITGCSDNNDITDQEIIYMDKHYDNFKFGEDSYWVYQDSATNALDSIFIASTETGFYWNPPSVHGIPGTKREFYKMKYKNEISSTTYFDFIDSYGIRRNTETVWEICGRLYYTLNPQSEFEIIDILSVNGIDFFNVMKSEIIANDYVEGCDSGGFTYDTEFYTVENYGIIKMVVKKDQDFQIWNLVRWKINK